MSECEPSLEIQKGNCVGVDNITEEMGNGVQNLCNEDSNFIASDVRGANPDNDYSKKVDLNMIDSSDKKAKWSFTWKGKTKRVKADNVGHGSDSHFGTNCNSACISFEPLGGQKVGATTRSKRTEKPRDEGSKINPSRKAVETNLSGIVLDNTGNTKTIHQIQHETDKEPSDLLSLTTECRNRGFENDLKSIRAIENSCEEDSCKNLESESDIVALSDNILCEGALASKNQLSCRNKNNNSLTDSLYNVKDTENFDTDSKSINLEICDNPGTSEQRIKSKEMMDGGLCKTTDKTRLEAPKKSYFDILMQSSEASAGKNQICAQEAQENHNSKICKKAKGDTMKDSSGKNNERNRKVKKTSRKGKFRGDSKAVDGTNSSESPMKKQNKHDSKIQLTETGGRFTVKKSTLRKIEADKTENEELNIECIEEGDKDQSESLTRKSRTVTRRSAIATSSNDQLQKTEEMEICEGNGVVATVPLPRSLESDLSEGGGSNQSGNIAKDAEENAVSTKQKRKSKRLR